MKKKNIYLMQAFEEGTDGAGAAGAAPEGGKPGTDGNNGAGQGAGASGGNNGAQGAEKKYTDAELDAILNKKFAEWQKKQTKAVDEATKLANMSAEEKAKAWEQKYNELLAQNNRAKLTAQATRLIAEAGLPAMTERIIATLVADDAETTKANVDAYVKDFNDKLAEARKNDAKKPAPKGGNSSGKTITKEEILAEKNQAKRQKLIAEHMDLFKA